MEELRASKDQFAVGLICRAEIVLSDLRVQLSILLYRCCGSKLQEWDHEPRLAG